MRFTKEVRQTIIEDFAKRHGGVYDPVAFVAEVQKKGKAHPAHAWFTWRDDTAAYEYRLWQARTFVQGLVVRFKIEEVGARGKMRIVETEMPFAMSPTGEEGKKRGGYVIVDPNSEEHVSMLCGEAATALQTWLNRYTAAIHLAGMPERVIISMVEALSRRAGGEESEAAE